MMEQSNDIGEASSSSNKKQKVSGIEQEDRISSLPDSIVAYILSFLPTEIAAKTVLVRRFGHLWTSIHNLDFNVRLYDNLAFTHPNDKWFLNFMDHILLLHEYPTILKFGLKFESASYDKPYMIRHHDSLSPRMTDKIDLWIRFAVRKKVKVLELDILDRGLYGPLFNYDLPNFVFMSDYLTELKLVSCGLKPKGQIHLSSLKTLSLWTIVLNDNMIEEILSGCPSLENLTMIRCYGLRKLNLTSTSLKILVVTHGEAETSRLEISCPNLRSLNISGSIGHVDLKNASSLVEATLEFYYGGRYSNDEYLKVGMLFEELSCAKFLTICNWCILVLTIWELTNRTCPSFNSKCVVLKTKLTKWHLPGIASLLRNSPSLKMLTIYIEPGSSLLTPDDEMWLKALGIHGNNCWDDEMWLRSYDFDGENYWNSQPHFPCLTNHLKTVRIYGCIENSYLIQLLKFLLVSSSVLEKVVISTKKNAFPHQLNQSSLQKLLELSQKLFFCPKASNVVITFT